MRHHRLVRRRVNAVSLLNQPIDLLQEVSAVLVTFRISLADQRQLPGVAVVPASSIMAASKHTHKRKTLSNGRLRSAATDTIVKETLAQRDFCLKRR